MPFCLAGAAVCLAAQGWYSMRTRVWVLGEWNQSVVLVRTCDGQNLLFGTGINAPSLAHAVLKSGSTRLDGVFVTRYDKKEQQNALELAQEFEVAQTVYARAGEAWPSDTWTFGNSAVKAIWGKHSSRTNGEWEQPGYSGAKGEMLSFEVQSCGKTLVIGAGQFFVQTPQGPVQSVRNGTVSVAI